MSSFEHRRAVILTEAEHLLQHNLQAFGYLHPMAPGVANVEAALDWLFSVIYPRTQATVANVAALPLVGNTIGDLRTVTDDGDGKAASYKWLQLEGEVAPSWHKVYDMDWGTGDVLSYMATVNQEMFVVRGGLDERDAAGALIAGLYAGQRIFGGATAGSNLTLAANSGDGVGADTGYVQVDDNFRPTANETLNSGTATERWLKVFTKSAEIGTTTIADGTGEVSITNTVGAFNFGSNALTTTGAVTGASFNIPGFTTWLLGTQPSLSTQILGFDAINQASGEPNGIEDASDITISYNLATREITLTGNFVVYTKGVKRTITGPVVLAHADTTGSHFFYYNSAGTFVTTTSAWSILNDVPVVLVYYNNTAASGIWAGPEAFLLEERHGITMDGPTHQEFHNALGTYIKGSGFTLSGTYQTAAGSGTVGDNTYGISGGTIVDEDIETVIADFSEGNGVTTVYPVFYRIGAGTEWRWTMSNVPYIITAPNIVYNQFTGGNWQLTQSTSNGRYINYYIAAVPFLSSTSGNSYRFVWIMGQTEFTSLAGAQGDSYLGLDLNGLPFAEIVPLYQITMRRELSYDDTGGNTRIESVRRIVGTRATSAASVFSPSNHNTLSNRSDANSHPSSAIGVVDTSFDGWLAGVAADPDPSLQAVLDYIDNLKSGVTIGNVFYYDNTIQVTNTDGELNLVANGTGHVHVWNTFIPHVDNSTDLGTATERFQDLFLSGNIGDGTNTISMATLMSLRGVTTNADVGDVLIWNGTQWVADVADTEVKHELISGLHSGSAVPSTNPDAGHTQFVLLAGRSGGQTVQGGTAASETLVLESTAHATKGTVQTKDNFVAFTNASYGGGVWSGTDIGDATHYFRDVYTKGEFKGFRLENVAVDPAFSGQNIGRMFYNTVDGKVKYDTGTEIKEVGSGGAGGAPTWVTSTAYVVGDLVYYLGAIYRCKLNHTSGATLEADYAAGDKWDAYVNFEASTPIVFNVRGGTSIAPSRDLINNLDSWIWSNTTAAFLYASFKVPNNLPLGSKVRVNIPFYCAATSGTATFRVTATLITPYFTDVTGTASGHLAITSTTNQFTPTDITITLATTGNGLMYYSFIIAPSGEINSVDLQGKYIILSLNKQGGTVTTDIVQPYYGAEVTYSL